MALSFEALPAPLLAHIVSYLIENSRSIPALRRISKNIRDAVIPLIPVELLLGADKCQFPSCTPLSLPFVSELLDYPEEGDEPRCGDRWMLSSKLEPPESMRDELFAGFQIISYFWLDDEPYEEPPTAAAETSSADAGPAGDPERLRDLCLAMIKAKDVTELRDLRDEGEKIRMFRPAVSPPVLDAKRKKKKDEISYRCIVTVAVQKEKLSTVEKWDEASSRTYRLSSSARAPIEEDEEDEDEEKEEEKQEVDDDDEEEEEAADEEEVVDEGEEGEEEIFHGDNDDNADDEDDEIEWEDDDMDNFEFEEAEVDNDYVEEDAVAFGDGKCNMLIPRHHAGGCHFGYMFEEDPVYTGSDFISLHVPLVLESSQDEWYEVFYTLEPEATSLPLTQLWNRHQRKAPEEGVVIVDGIVPAKLKQTLKDNIDVLKATQDPPDYHPHSDFVVRDLVHPALFSYVKDLSPLVASVGEVPPCVFWKDDDDWKDEDDLDMRPEDENDGDAGRASENAVDYWGRPYESSSKYQWLPTYFNVDEHGGCTIQDYINNLAPRERHEALYSGLEDLFRQALPFLESVYSYCRGVRGRIRQTDDWPFGAWEDDPPSPIKERPTSLRGQKLQVITKIVDYELKPGQTYSGVWHVEGMSHEEIVATALYILDRDDEIEGGDIMYKRAFHKREAIFISSTVVQCRPHHLEEIISDGLIPVGTAATPKDRLIVFPNSHVHRVTAMANVAKEMEGKVATRRIVVFFLVNPERRIVSTREVPPQQPSAGGTMSLAEAMEHRQNLMVERKFSKQDWNVRDIELCEH